MVVAAGWPGMASAGIHGTGQAVPSPAPTAKAWLLGRTAPALLPTPTTLAAPAVTTDAHVAPLKHVLPVDVVAVSATTLPAKAVNKVRDLAGVRAVQAVDAARVRVNGRFAAVLGVNPSGFRRFAAKPTAKDNAFWRSVEGGGLGLSYEMGKPCRTAPWSSSSWCRSAAGPRPRRRQARRSRSSVVWPPHR
jgi:hypothetical protein